jgi:hypothetical protein
MEPRADAPPSLGLREDVEAAAGGVWFIRNSLLRKRGRIAYNSEKWNI